MAKLNINPDSLAAKTFFMTVVDAVLYITVVFTFVIGKVIRRRRTSKA